jgi:hypothetical protein
MSVSYHNKACGSKTKRFGANAKQGHMTCFHFLRSLIIL